MQSSGEDDKKCNKEPLWVHFISGACAGGMSRLCTAPLDRLKIYLQVRGTKRMGTTVAVQEMYKDGGVRSFWRGNGVNLLKISPEMAVKFAIFEEAKKFDPGMSTLFIAGAASGFLAASAVYPLEVLKTRLALRTSDECGSIRLGLKNMWSEGLHGLYKGYIPNIFGVIPYAGLELGVYETMKELLHMDDKESLSVMDVLLCSGTASFVGQMAVYPLGLLKTRLQSNDFKDESFSSMAIKIYYSEGVIGFYRGLMPTCVRVLPTVMINFLVMETVKAKLTSSRRVTIKS